MWHQAASATGLPIGGPPPAGDMAVEGPGMPGAPGEQPPPPSPPGGRARPRYDRPRKKPAGTTSASGREACSLGVLGPGDRGRARSGGLLPWLPPFLYTPLWREHKERWHRTISVRERSHRGYRGRGEPGAPCTQHEALQAAGAPEGIVPCGRMKAVLPGPSPGHGLAQGPGGPGPRQPHPYPLSTMWGGGANRNVLLLFTAL